MNGYSTRSKSNDISFVKEAKPNLTLFEYPPNGEVDPNRSKITFTEHDFKQLKTPRFLNDTIISFFMQYHLDKHVSQKVKDRIHVFNSFFFAKLTSIKSNDLGSAKESQHDSKAFKCISRWLKNVRIFKKDFLIMPVCERDHWVLVIVCYPANKHTLRSHLIPEEDLYEPAVIILNSSHGHAPKVKKSLNQFLKYQWEQEMGESRSFTIHNAKANGIRLIFPELPQQKNYYDCGVYVLNYFYCFLKDPRKAYLKLYRQRNLTKWFLENDIDIPKGRRYMNEIIKEQMILWKSVKETQTAPLLCIRSSEEESDSSENTLKQERSSSSASTSIIVID